MAVKTTSEARERLQVLRSRLAQAHVGNARDVQTLARVLDEFFGLLLDDEPEQVPAKRKRTAKRSK